MFCEQGNSSSNFAVTDGEQSQLFTELTLSEQEDLSGGWGWPSWKQVKAAGVATSMVGGVISLIPGGQAIGGGVTSAGVIIATAGVAGDAVS